MQSPRNDKEQRVVSEPGAMGNNQGTGIAMKESNEQHEKKELEA